MRSLVCSSTIPSQIYTPPQFSRFCKARCLWHTIKDSRLTKIILCRARCSKIQMHWKEWLMKQEQKAPIWSRPKLLSIFAKNAAAIPIAGSPKQKRFGMAETNRSTSIILFTRAGRRNKYFSPNISSTNCYTLFPTAERAIPAKQGVALFVISTIVELY